jgi:hypothetical protein
MKMIDKNVMRDFILRVQNDGTLDMAHRSCKMSMRDSRGNIFNPVNLREAYELAEEHLLNECPGSEG